MTWLGFLVGFGVGIACTVAAGVFWFIRILWGRW